MESLFIRVSLYTNDSHINSYYLSVIQDENGRIDGYGVDGNYHTSLSVRGKIGNNSIYLDISYNETKVKHNVDILNRRIIAYSSKDNFFYDDLIGKRDYHGKTIDESGISTSIEVMNVKKYVQSMEHNRQFTK